MVLQWASCFSNLNALLKTAKSDRVACLARRNQDLTIQESRSVPQREALIRQVELGLQLLWNDMFLGIRGTLAI
jgi:hypothetical protein